MTAKEIPYKIYLEENEMPTAWYNVRADMKNKPAPLIHPGTHQPMSAEELSPVFCEELCKQEHEAYNAVLSAVSAGEIEEDRVDESLRRILRVKLGR